MKHLTSYNYKKLEELMQISLEKMKSDLTLQDIQDISEYIEYGEYGVAWELLWYIIKKENLSAPDEFIVCGKKMGYLKVLSD